MMWVSRFQGTTFEDEESMWARLVCHRIIDVLPKKADQELVEVLVEMFKFYGQPRGIPALPEPTGPSRRPVTKINRSVRPDVTFVEEG
jgi:hypothetical protein